MGDPATAVTLGASLLVAVGILVGAATQRSVGLGFALISAPFAVLVLGPGPGILLLNLLGIPTAVVVLLRSWRDVDRPRLIRLIIPAAIGVLPGVWLVAVAPAGWLEVVLGLVVLLALLVVVLPGAPRTRRLTAPSIVAGLASGFMNAAAGIGGPPLVVYRMTTGMPMPAFVATIQPILIVMSVLSFVVKLASGASPFPALPPVGWLVILGSLVAGILVGEVASARVNPSIARACVFVLAAAGAVATLIAGLTTITTLPS